MASIETRAAARSAFPRRALFIALVTLGCTFAVVLSGHSTGFLQRIEQGFTDIRTALFSDRITGDHPDIVIVSVGANVSATRATFGRDSIDMDRGQLARLIDAIDDSAPRAIGFDVPLLGAGDATKDQSLQRALREAKARVVIASRTSSAESNPERRAWLERFVSGTGRPLGHVTTLYDEGMGRAVAFDSGVQAIGRVPDSFALLMARALRPELRRDFSDIAWLQKVDDAGWISRFFNVGGQQPFRLLFGEDLIDSTKPIPTRAFAGRLVLITTGMAEIERHRTPLTLWSGESLAPIQIQAQAMAQMLDRRAITGIDSRTTRLALFALACVAGLIGWFRGPGLHIVGTLMAIVALVALDATAYSMRDLALPLLPALIVWLLGEAAGRSLRGILDWEERNGLKWPLEEEPEAR